MPLTDVFDKRVLVGIVEAVDFTLTELLLLRHDRVPSQAQRRLCASPTTMSSLLVEGSPNTTPNLRTSGRLWRSTSPQLKGLSRNHFADTIRARGHTQTSLWRPPITSRISEGDSTICMDRPRLLPLLLDSSQTSTQLVWLVADRLLVFLIQLCTLMQTLS